MHLVDGWASSGLHFEGKWAADRQKKLIEIIPRPLWERWRGDRFAEPEGADSLILMPLLLRMDPMASGCSASAMRKYYVPSVSGKMEPSRGLESVTKQFLYQSARGFIETCGFDRVVNVFLVPGTVDRPELDGEGVVSGRDCGGRKSRSAISSTC